MTHKPLLKTASIQKLESEIAHRVEDLFIPSPPVQLDKWEEYFNSLHRRRREVTDEIWIAITSARLDEFSSGVVPSAELDKPTKRDPWDDWISLRLFCNDVASLLCNHYGDIDRAALAQTLNAVFSIVVLHSRLHNNSFCIEWFNARDLQEVIESPSYIDLIEAAMAGIDITRALKAIHQNNRRARAVLESPSNFSKYTIQFAKIGLSTDPPGASTTGPDR